jgi:hypothetical protein
LVTYRSSNALIVVNRLINSKVDIGDLVPKQVRAFSIGIVLCDEIDVLRATGLVVIGWLREAGNPLILLIILAPEDSRMEQSWEVCTYPPVNV